MENFEKNNIPSEDSEKSEAEKEKKEIKTDFGNKTNAVNQKTDFVEFQEGIIKKEKEKIEEIIKTSEKIKEETDKLFNQEKKD